MKSKSGLSTVFLLSTIVLFILPSRSGGVAHRLPPSVAPEMLSETVPFVFDPADFSIRDFEVTWGEGTIEGVEAGLVPNSFEWVRVSDVLVLPRGRLRVKASSIVNGKITHNGFVQPFENIKEGEGFAEIPVALISGKENPILVTVKRGGQDVSAKLHIGFQQSGSSSGRVLVDTTCSPYWVDVSGSEVGKDSWAIVGCRQVYSKGENYLVPSLELYVFWDNVGQEISVNNERVASSSVSIWPLRMRSAPATVTLSAGAHQIKLKYSVPDRLRLGFLGLGVGPYTYMLNPEGDFADKQVNTTTVLATFYGSLFFTEMMRIVMFSAVPIHRRFFVDTGIYILLEQARVFDTRFSVNFLLGGHLLAFPYRNDKNFVFSFPQGIEMIFREFPARRYHLGAGAFIYPLSSQRSYFNVWVRLGNPRFFGEVNYISWQEPMALGNVKAEVLGLSVGFPLLRFF